jgi:phosphate transport system substrate-binding protein
MIPSEVMYPHMQENGSQLIGPGKKSTADTTSITNRSAGINISIFDQNNFKHIFSRDTYYNKSVYAFKNYYWSDVTGVLGAGFFNTTNQPDCGEKAAFAEWLLRRYGIKASIVMVYRFPGLNCSHAWVKVKTPLNETIFVDLSRSPASENSTGYIKTGGEYKHFDREFKDIFEAESDYNDSCSDCKRHFDWWDTDWGKAKLIDLGFYDNETITVAGSAEVYPIIDAEVKAFNAQHSGCKVSLSGGSNIECISALAENTSDAALISRELSNSEYKKYGNNLRQFSIGLDGTIIIVSKSIWQAGIKDLTAAQLRDIYAGKITNWKDLSGPDRQIYVIAGRKGRETFNKTIMEEAKIGALGVSTKQMNDIEVETAVAGSDRAIGYIDYANLGNENVSAVAIDGVFPTVQNIRNESYKFRHPPIYLYTYIEPDQCVRTFIKFLNSSAGQNITAMYDEYL